MNTGLTIAFICNGKKGEDHSTLANYKKFGNKYWDDAQNNQSKIGYYFAFYFQQKYVYIHKIINILQPNERPIEMNWTSNKQILCLSKQLHKFTWNEWINGIGLGAPYTPNYRNTQTGSWSYFDLQNHIKYRTFNFNKFKDSIIEDQDTVEEEEEEEEEEVIDEIEELRKKLKEAEIRKLEKDARKNINILRETRSNELKIKRDALEKQISELMSKKVQIDLEIEENNKGSNDEQLVKLFAKNEMSKRCN